MRREILEGIKTRLRPITIDDAAFMANLRNKPKNKKFLSNRDEEINIDHQLNWMKSQMKRDDTINFIIESTSDNVPVGNVAIYDILENGEAEFGRYICEDTFCAVESEYLNLKYAFDILNLKKIYCKTVKKNDKVWKQHIKFGFTKEGEDHDDRINEDRVIQFITNEDFKAFDYNPILDLIKRFS